MEKLIYKNRRESLKNHLPENCALIIPGADLQYRNADSSYLLRQESSFFYFSGFCEPSSLMVMVNNGKSIDSIIFVPEKDKLREIIKLDTLTLDLRGNEGRKNVLNRFNIEKMCFNTYSEYKKLIN